MAGRRSTTRCAACRTVSTRTLHRDREDITDIPLVTIDGEDARDFDDAVFCRPRPKGGWRLVVAIADVGSYVQLGSALDIEARERGNSVYLPDRVVPMLPEALSNGLCSLRPQEHRLCHGVRHAGVAARQDHELPLLSAR